MMKNMIFLFYILFILSYYIVFIEKPIFVMYFFIAEFWALELFSNDSCSCSHTVRDCV